MVYSGDGPAALGRLWTAPDLGCLVTGCDRQPDRVLANTFYHRLYCVVCVVPLFAQPEDPAWTRRLWYEGRDRRRRAARQSDIGTPGLSQRRTSKAPKAHKAKSMHTFLGMNDNVWWFLVFGAV